MSHTAEPNGRRRALLLGAAAAPALGWVGCASVGAAPSPKIEGEAPGDLRAFLKPPGIVKTAGAPKFVRDVHAHFFNARDVPVKGYLAGPVAHGAGGLAEKLLRRLAGFAEQLAALAPSAALEYRTLVQRGQSSALLSIDAAGQGSSLAAERDDYLRGLSSQVFELLKDDTEFRQLFNQAQSRNKAALSTLGLAGAGSEALDEGSLYRAMQQDRQRTGPETKALAADPGESGPDYADGVLAFLGYMLSYRWMNLLAYQDAYTSGAGAFGIDEVYAALVDFDHWLTPPPRSAHEDQIKLHQLLSQLSGGYMRPLVAYNPWSDAVDGGKTLARVLDALDKRGFVGVKLYPPNGYRVYGNVAFAGQVAGAPGAAALDAALLRLWQECAARGKPVMTHSGHSMGSSDALQAQAGPAGYTALLAAFSGAPQPPRISAGHFGGFSAAVDWTADLTKLMNAPGGAGLYADLAYWDGLSCSGSPPCAAVKRLADALQAGQPVAAQRVMYGSDWLMLSQLRRWDRYPHDLLAATKGLIAPDALFGGNARRLFGA